MRSYELVIIVKGSITEALRKKIITGVKTLLKDFKFVKEKEVGQKALAYKIKREKDGFYYDFVIEGENLPRGFEKKLLENEDVLRHLMIRLK